MCPPRAYTLSIHPPWRVVGAAEDVFTTACGQQRCGSDGAARARRGKPGSPHRCLPHPVSWPEVSSPSFSSPSRSRASRHRVWRYWLEEESNAHITSWWKHCATRARDTDPLTTATIPRLACLLFTKSMRAARDVTAAAQSHLSAGYLTTRPILPRVVNTVAVSATWFTCQCYSTCLSMLALPYVINFSQIIKQGLLLFYTIYIYTLHYSSS